MKPQPLAATALAPLLAAAASSALLAPPVLGPAVGRALSGRRNVYFAKALASAFFALTFWLPTKESTVTAIARSMSWLLQKSDRRILQKDSAMRIIASR